MARYNRDFIVPYLRNICSLYFARQRIQEWYWTASKKADAFDVYYHDPKIPHYEDSMGCASYVLIGFIVLLLLLVKLAYDSNNWIMALPCAFLVLICVVCLICISRNVGEGNKKKLEEYNAKVDAAEKRYFAEAEKAKQEKIRLESRMNAYMREINRIDALLDRLYSANIIPTMYRDSYAAVYLYDWFSTGNSDNMDHALSMYVLEQIKSRLDRIIDNQSQMILNQSIMMANQVRSMEQRKQYENQMKMKLNRLQTTADEQLRYTRMIEANTAVLTFFANADYLKNS